MRPIWKPLLISCLLCIQGFASSAAVDSSRADTAAAGGAPKGIDVSKLTRDDILKMSNKDLVNLPFEDLMTLADKLGVSVDELLNMKVSVSSKKAVTPRESPGIISVVSDEEIANSGARDLIDVLRLVPGFEFGSDVEGVTSIGVRGIWGEEGKVLLLIDGQEINELSYSSLPIGGRFDVSQIKRVEILRGPGSCIYGGFAELSVINIITKKSDDINGASANVTYGQMPDAMGRANGTVSVGKFFKGGDFSLKMFGSTANRSDRDYTATTENGDYDFTMKNSGIPDAFSNLDLMRLNAGNVNASISYNNLSGRFMYDYYQTEIYATSFDSVNSTLIGSVAPDKFKSYFGELRYDWQVTDKLSITPKVNYKGQSAWETFDPIWIYDVFVSRYTGSVVANYDYSDNINVLGGFEGYIDDAVQTVSSYDTFPNGKQEIAYDNMAAFAQGLFKTKYINFILGGRADYHNAYGWAFSPRLGITGIIDKFHYKAVLSQAFRAPGIENIRVAKMGLGLDIKPEKTTDFEGEVGYKIGDNMIVTANIFDISIKDPIIYFADNATGAEGYENYAKTGSSGFELEYRTKYTWGYSSVNYSYTNPQVFSRNSVSTYEVPGHADKLLAFPQHKFTFNVAYYLGSLCIDPSFTFLSQRFAYDSTDANGAVYASEKQPQYLCNLYLRYKDVFVKGFDVGAGVYDILNQRYDFIQPYQGDKPWPGPSREFVFRVTYGLKF